MGKLPAIQFYVGDWMKDPALRSVSLEARGLWIDLICIMHESPRRGYLENAKGEPLTDVQIGRMTGTHPRTIHRLLIELSNADVLAMSDRCVAFNRRMKRDEEARQLNAKRQEDFRNAHKIQDETLNSNGKVTEEVTVEVTGIVTPLSHRSSSSSSSSSSKLSTQTVPNGTVSTEAVKPRSVAAPDPALVAGWLPIIRSRKTTPLGQQFVRVGEEYRYRVLHSQVDEWTVTFPGVSVMQELREMKQWLIADPTRRKTDRGIVKFIVSWLAREQDKAGGGNRNGINSGHSNEPVQRFESVDERGKRIADAAKQRIDQKYRGSADEDGSDAAHQPTRTH